MLSQQGIFNNKFGLTPAEVSQGIEEQETTGWLGPPGPLRCPYPSGEARHEAAEYIIDVVKYKQEKASLLHIGIVEHSRSKEIVSSEACR